MTVAGLVVACLLAVSGWAFARDSAYPELHVAASFDAGMSCDSAAPTAARIGAPATARALMR